MRADSWRIAAHPEHGDEWRFRSRHRGRGDDGPHRDGVVRGAQAEGRNAVNLAILFKRGWALLGRSRKARLALFGLLAFAAGGLMAIVCGPGEPSYAGKSLSF